MPKGYWIAHVTVEDAEVYDRYRAANAAPFAEYGARFLVRAGSQSVEEGTARARTVVLEFPTIEAARACYASEAYRAAKAIRDPVATSDLVIVEGYEGEP
ncbi:MAG: DUF1330 domain-containing protein [Pseudomonadota bacterium]